MGYEGCEEFVWMVYGGLDFRGRRRYTVSGKSGIKLRLRGDGEGMDIRDC